MCLLIFAFQTSDAYPLLVAANRDEFHQRPTLVSDFWSDHPQLLAGRDQEHGGTWMGITRQGRFAAITNFRDFDNAQQYPTSRGALTTNFLHGDADPAQYLAAVANRGADYAGFNLLLGDINSLWYYSNRGPEQPQALQPGVYGLSNALLDTPWPKVEQGKAGLKSLLAKNSTDISHRDLQALVSDREQALGEEGEETEMERILSAQFIRSSTYGTRCTTTLLSSSSGSASWRESSFDAEGETTGVSERDFNYS